MLHKLNSLFAKIDFRVSGSAFSRPQYQVKLIINRVLALRHHRKLPSLLDIGGGVDPQYKLALSKITKNYKNLELAKGSGVDIVGTVYKIPLASASVSAVSLFMVLEHLSEPNLALRECGRILTRNGFLLLTTVQYWHTHAHPDDYYRYTNSGLEYLCRKSGFEILDIWSHGGPILVVFHAIELNLPPILRLLFSIVFYRPADYLDGLFFAHFDKRQLSDSVGWSVIAKKK